MTNQHLNICLLGAPTIRRNGDGIDRFVSRSAQALFYFLATTGRRHDRSWLAALLWPETAEGTARKNLRDVLSNLRLLFGKTLHITHDSAACVLEQPNILDVQRFGSLAAAWRQHGDPQALREMAALYRGEFLEGFHPPDSVEFESWLMAERERLRDQVLWAMDLLVELALKQEDFGAGLTFSRRILAMEPWREKTHRQRMLLLAASGQRAAAISQYEQCKAYLQSEFGVEPLAETTRVYEQVRADHLGEMTPHTLEDHAAIGGSALRPLRHNLPRLYTPLFGREQEIAALTARLREPTCALLTVTGEGGVGKTRVALAVAEHMLAEYPDGVWFAPLAGLSVDGKVGETGREENAAEAIGAVIARAMQISLPEKSSVFHHVLDVLSEQKSLLVLDNFEHLTEFSPLVLRILEASPASSILVTSRHRLHLQAEYVFTLSGLPIPTDPLPSTPSDISDLVRRFSSLQLFSERAQRSGAAFVLQQENLEAVMEICRMLEGLPLGIELAASLTPTLTPVQLATKLKQTHRVLATDMADIPLRHRSLQAVLDYSWRLLSPAEAQMLTQCAIFTARFSATAVEAISGLTSEHLQTLAHKSLLRQLDNNRFVLQPVVRQWAYEKLSQDAQRLAETKAAFQSYFMAFVAGCATQIGNDAAVNRAVQAESAHILAAWQYAIEQQNVEMLHQGARGVFQLFKLNGRFNEGAQTFVRAVECVDALCSYPDALTIHGNFLAMAAHLHAQIGQLDLSCAEARQAWAISQQTGDRTLEIDSLQRLAYSAWFSGNLDEGARCNAEGLRLAHIEGNLAAKAFGLGGMGIFLQHQGEIDRAIEMYEQALGVAQNAGEIRLALMMANFLGAAYLTQGNLWLAYIQFNALLPLRQHVGDALGEGVTLMSLTKTAIALGDLSKATQHGLTALAIFRGIAARRHESLTLTLLSRTFHQLGDQETAYAYAQQALQVSESTRLQPTRADALLALGSVLTAQGQLHNAHTVFEEAIHAAEQIRDTVIITCAQVRCARALLIQGQKEKAHELVQRALPYLPELKHAWSYDPIAIHIHCYAVLKALEDSSAPFVLEAANTLLCEQAAKLEDKEIESRFLQNIPSHQELPRLLRDKHRQDRQRTLRPTANRL